MTISPSHIPVSVDETENGYVVHAGSAVATISRTIVGYAVDANSQILKEEYALSPSVAQARKSAHDLVQFSPDQTDDTRLILRGTRSFLVLSQAVEMVCGFLPEHFPREDEWKLISAWKNSGNVVSESESITESEVSNNTPETSPTAPAQEEFGTTLSDIVSMAEEEADSEFQSHSWSVKSHRSAVKILDKSAFEHHETGVPKDVAEFFGADHLPAGGRKEISLLNSLKKFTGYLIKDSTKSERVKIRWDSELAALISDFRKRNGDNLSLEFLKMYYPDSYNIILKRIVGAAGNSKNKSEPSVSSEIKEDAESTVTSVSESTVTYSPDVLRIHEAVSKLPRYRFDVWTKVDVQNGLILVFEEGEKYRDYDRIVYVGINRKSGNLPERVKILTSGKKEDVVLRKYLGTALLRKEGHNYARIWAKDSSSPEAIRRIGTFYDPAKEAETEARVSEYLRKHMSFSVVEIPNSTRRTLLQTQLVSTLKEGYLQSPLSHTWIGRYHPELDIRAGDIWMKGDKRARPFNEGELETFLREVQGNHAPKQVKPSAPSSSPTVVSTDTQYPVESVPGDDADVSITEVSSLDDVLKMEYSDEKEHILIKVVKHHLRLLGVENIRVLVLAPLILHSSIPKTKIFQSCGPGYTRDAIFSCINSLIEEKVVETYQLQRIARPTVTHYKLHNLGQIISNLSGQKESELKVLSTTLETVVKLLEDEYTISEECYISQYSETYDKIRDELINPIISLGLTQEVAKLLVYLHLFRDVDERKVHDFLLRDLSQSKEMLLLRKLFSASWINAKEEQRKENGKWVITKHYHLTQPLEDILVDYVLTYGEALDNSVEELKRITAYLAEHPLTLSEVNETQLEQEVKYNNTVVQVSTDTSNNIENLEKSETAYSTEGQGIPVEKVDENIMKITQRSTYKYSVPKGSIDEWKPLYISVISYHVTTIQDMGSDFSLYDMSDRRNLTLLGNELANIIKLEGPISKNLLIHRVMDLHSISRFGERMESNITYSLQILVNQGRIKRYKDLDQEYYTSKLHPIVPRKRLYPLNISFSEISPDEICAMILSCLLKKNQYVINTLIEDVYEGFGYQSQITISISNRIERVINDMMYDGLVKIENKTVSFVTEKS